MAEYLAALTAAVTAVGGAVALAAAVVNLVDRIRKRGADGGEGPGRWLAAGAAGVVLVAVGVMAFKQWEDARPRYSLAVEIQDKQSRPDRIIAKKVFTGIASRELSQETLGEITGWINAELQSKNYALEAAPIDIRVEIPADASAQKIIVIPSDSGATLSYGFERGIVVDTLSPENLAPSLERSYYLVVERPRYEPVWLRVSPGTSQVAKRTLDPVPIRIMVGKITCGDTPAAKEDENLAEQLEAMMVDYSRVTLYTPEAYEEIAQTLGNRPDAVVRQEPWEVDLLILGNYERV